MTVDHELLAHLETIALSSDPPLVVSGGWVISV
jgi:hypothetical protein